MSYVNRSVRKKDAMQLVTGKPVYTDDLSPDDCLIVKLLRSPYAHAKIKNINTAIAMKVPGIEAIFTYKDCPHNRFTLAGQTAPETSSKDRYIMEDHLRFVGDTVAIVAGTSEKAVNRALKMIKVDYEVLPAVFDAKEAMTSDIIVHPEDDWKAPFNFGHDPKHNIVSSESHEEGDVDGIYEECEYKIDQTYHVKAVQQSMMETFRTYAYMDVYGRLNVVSSTQITFHCRRIIANALDIPKSKVRVIKPRIGGGFGAKQTAVSEIYPAFVTWKTGKPSKIIFSREESMTASSPRHDMEVHVRMGANKEGIVRVLDVHTISNTGAYAEHGWATVGLSGHKSIPLYGKAEAFRFGYDVVYTNRMSAGAYRGFGATQGQFAVESAANEMAEKIGMDPAHFREINMVEEGQDMPAYYNEHLNACALDRCMAKAKEMIGWDEKSTVRDMGNGKVRSLGIAMSMQGSGISGVDVGSVTLKLSDEGFYNMMIGCSDMGTGCDTILAQMAADCLMCDIDDIIVYGVDTDTAPYDSGSYASSTTYVTGGAVMKTAEKLIAQMTELAAHHLGVPADELEFDGKQFATSDESKVMTLRELAFHSQEFNPIALQATEMNTQPVSPPPFMVGIADVEIDMETGKVEMKDYVAVVDCGTVINPALATVQVQGGIGQGIGMALFEDVSYTPSGRVRNNSFMQYKIPNRIDLGKIRVAFESSYEPTGPFGAKSIGEIVINTPAPAIANAVARATGVHIRELPITGEKILRGMGKL